LAAVRRKALPGREYRATAKAKEVPRTRAPAVARVLRYKLLMMLE
jgi:hypothetical protein